MSTLSFSTRRYLMQHTNHNNSPLEYVLNVVQLCGSRKVVLPVFRADGQNAINRVVAGFSKAMTFYSRRGNDGV